MFRITVYFQIKRVKGSCIAVGGEIHSQVKPGYFLSPMNEGLGNKGKSESDVG